MKKLLFAVTTVLFSTLLFAQSVPKYGIKAGLNISNTHNTVSGNSDSKAGFHVGLLSHIHLAPQWSLQPEVVFSNQGAKVGDVSLNLNYINVPVLVQYNFDNGFRLQTGPQLGVLVGVSDKYKGTTSNLFTKSDFQDIDFAWSFGASYLGYSGFGLDARYNLGISKINNDPAREGKTTNRVIQLGVFYLFDHNHKAHSR